MTESYQVVLFTLAVCGSAAAILAGYDIWAASHGGVTLSQAFSDFGRRYPFVIVAYTLAACVPLVAAAHFWWPISRPGKNNGK